jgi:hypothetical protein
MDAELPSNPNPPAHLSHPILQMRVPFGGQLSRVKAPRVVAVLVVALAVALAAIGSVAADRVTATDLDGDGVPNL